MAHGLTKQSSPRVWVCVRMLKVCSTARRRVALFQQPFERKADFRNSIVVLSSAIAPTLFDSSTPLCVQAPPPVMTCCVIRHPNSKLVNSGVSTHGKTVVL